MLSFGSEAGRRRRALGVVIGILVAGAACRKTESSTPTAPDGVLPDGGKLARTDVLAAFASCVTSATEDFVARATAFEAATSAYAANPTDELQAPAREAFQAAMTSWQRLETMQLGPLSSSGHPGAQNLREEIYSWPTGGRCLIEQALVDKTYETGLAKALVNTRGLLAAEYLLFYSGTDNACGAAAPINAQGQWAAIAPELRGRKAGYASAVAKDLVARATQLRDAFSPSAGNFSGELVKAGTGGKVYSTQQMAFNAVADAIFYLEYVVKDAKVGKPIGLVNCATPPCLDDVESPYARTSKRYIAENLRGARAFLAGCGEGGEGIGFDELLRGVGAEKSASELLADLDAAEAALAAIPGDDLRQAIVDNPGLVRAFYDALKNVTDHLKTDFVSVLDLELPQRAEGDND